MKVLIAGGAGFIGSTVASASIDDGMTPVILDNFSTGRVEFVRDRISYDGDICDSEVLDRIFSDHPDIYAAVHCAGLTVVPDSVAEPLRYYRENVSKSIDFIGHLVRHGCRRCLFSSSASIYRPQADFAVDEDSPFDPQSPYASTKAVMELLLADCARAYDFRVISLRYFNPIGADPKLRTGLQTKEASHVLGKMIAAATSGREFHVTGTDWPTRDGSGIRDYVHVWDLARAHLLALRRFDTVLPPNGTKRSEAINLGTGQGTTVRELLAAFEQVLGRPLRVRESPPRPGDVAGTFTRSERARQWLEWVPQLTLADGIRDSLAWSKIRDQVLEM
jgi:UDP-glucose 4-epimerase